MVKRFQIEEMVAQDASGVVFRAFDTETALPVAVRRLFPFGPNGGGLSESEQADYLLAVDRLAGISHPAMRSIIAGGCDPVDGMPFIATEWLEGQPLQVFLEQSPLTSAQASHVLTMAIEVCHQISYVLGEEAIWIETDVQTIIVGGDAEGRGVTFWISPLKWLGKSGGERGLKSLVSLTEDLMGWRGKMIHNHEGGGLGAWLKWLRQAPPQTQLQQVRDQLAAVANNPAPTPSRRLVRPPVRNTAPARKKAASNIPFFVGGILVLAALSVGGWSLVQWNNARLKSPDDSKKLANQPGEISSSSEIPSVVPVREGVHQPSESALLLTRVGDLVKLEGTLKAVERSSKGTGNTIYLIFEGGDDDARGGIDLENAKDELAESALKQLIGKKLLIEGIVKRVGRAKFALVLVKNASAIQKIP